ncbi:MAG TPA: tripartite tricarboxylate transporter substrate binding protein, partial [Reyranella sp.]|nr:tripartite tricarboxylate transporter substrate binding protein [Reyranella sp.]
MTLSRRGTLAGLGSLSLGSLALATTARAQAFPSKPLTLIVPFPAGGPADIFGRHLAHGLTAQLGKQVVVENKSGAAGVTGMDVVAKAGSDPHVIGIGSASAGSIMQSLMPRMPYDPERDLAPVILVVKVQEILVVNAKTGVTDFKGLLARLKAEPGKWTCGSAGSGGITHLAIELFKRETGTDILHVPYRGAAPATNDLVAGTIASTILDAPVLLPHIRSGALKALAVTSDVRSPLLPDVPTMRELGFPRVNSDNWYGLFAPGGSSLADRERLHDAAAAVLKSKDVIDAYTAVGGIVGGGSAEEFARFRRAEVAKWAEVIKLANV